MTRRRTAWIAVAILITVGAVFLFTRTPEDPTPNPPGTFSFAVLGDAPYYPWEDRQFRLMNGTEPFPARSEADDREVTRRTEAATVWLRESFAQAHSTRARAVVIAFHANPDFEQPADARYRQAYEPFLDALEQEVLAFGRPVLLTHGDNHEFVVDRPLVDRSTGRRLENVTRMQVPGSSDVGWIRVVVTPGAENPFAFESHIIPMWKYW